jgi:hypothetical protein
VLASGWVTTGRETELFEREFGTYVQAGHAVAVSSCTAAIELALRALRLPSESPVLVSTVTFCGVGQAVLRARLRPVLVDADPRAAMPSAAHVSLAARGCEGPGAMIVLHFAGAPAPPTEPADAACLPLRRASSIPVTALPGMPTWPSAGECLRYRASMGLQRTYTPSARLPIPASG